MVSVALVAKRRAMFYAPGKAVFWRSSGAPSAPPSGGGGGGATPASIAGLAGWWDASTYAGQLDGNNNPLPGWNNQVSAVADKSGNGVNLAAYSFASGGTLPQATPRLNGTLGGVGLNTILPPAMPSSGFLLPVMGMDTGLKLASASLGAGAAWTVFFVWSRPNYVQGNGAPSQITLLSCAGTVILAADAAAGSNARLILFPGASQTILTNALDRRHTHSVIIRNTTGVGVDVWLDGVQVSTATRNPSASALSGALLFLHAGTSSGSAQCWFHEAALWPSALASGSVTTLLTYATRWTRGARRGLQVIVIGQSNAGNGLNAGAWHVLAQGIAWHLGALAYNVLALYGSGSAYTIAGGHGISNAPFTGATVYPGSFLNDPGDGSNPSGWALGADGTAVQTYLGQQAAADLADAVLIFLPWSETDSIRAYSEKAFYNAAVQRFIALVRGMLSRAAASLPVLTWNAMPFGSGSTSGMQMVRETEADVAGAGVHYFIGLPQVGDSNPQGVSWNPATGVITNGASPDYNHLDPVDLARIAKLAAPVAARAILAGGNGDITETAIPAGVPSVGGPVISGVYQAVANTTTLLLTITHDAGNDLVVPLLAATGVGFYVMDGGSVASPGSIISATACTRVDATHLQITLSRAPTNAQAGLLFFYLYGNGYLGRGNAVTDNFASVTKPAGWDIAGDLGSAWSLNFPLAATTYGLPVTAPS
jgi:hypothetical protein